MPMRIILGIGSLLMIEPSHITDAVGSVMVIIALAWHYIECKK